MILSKPLLSVKRLVVWMGSRVVYDQVFTNGVNIIYGDNSSGKSTIIDLLYHSLGGTLLHWKPESLMCDFVFVEVDVNGALLCFKREVKEGGRSPVEIAYAGYSEAVVFNQEAWSQYPYSMSQGKDSFSQILFRALGYPEVRGEVRENVTMHQLLRLIFVDQLTAVNKIFRQDVRDSNFKREIVGDFLCGLYDDSIYVLRLDIAKIEKELDNIKRELAGIRKLLARYDRGYSKSDLEESVKLGKESFITLVARVKELKISQNIGNGVSHNSGSEYDDSYIELRAKIVALHEQRSRMLAEVEDSEAFVLTLNDRISSIQKSLETKKEFDGLGLAYCPICFGALGAPAEGECGLCKSKGSEIKYLNLIKFRNELEFQLHESSRMLEEKKKNLVNINAQIMRVENETFLVRERLSVMLPNVTNVQDEIDSLGIQISQVEQKMSIDVDRLSLVGSVSVVEAERREKESSLTLLQDKLNNINRDLSEKKDLISSLVSASVVSLLKKDLPLEDAFVSPENVVFSFSEDVIFVDGKNSFSASSMHVLKVLFHLGLLSTSLNNSSLRYPKLCVIDSIEDKGMQTERVHNLQQVVVDMSNNSKYFHQVLFTTSELNPKLAGQYHIVGPYYTRANRTLSV